MSFLKLLKLKIEVRLSDQLPDFGNLIWALPGFWCKQDFLLFTLDEYRVIVCRS